MPVSISVHPSYITLNSCRLKPAHLSLSLPLSAEHMEDGFYKGMQLFP